MIKEITSTEEFKEAVSEGLVLVDVYTTSCGGCKVYKTQLEEIQEDVKIIMVNAQEHPTLMREVPEIATMSVPHTFIYKNGEQVHNYTAFRPADQVLEIMSEFK